MYKGNEMNYRLWTVIVWRFNLLFGWFHLGVNRWFDAYEQHMKNSEEGDIIVTLILAKKDFYKKDAYYVIIIINASSLI